MPDILMTMRGAGTNMRTLVSALPTGTALFLLSALPVAAQAGAGAQSLSCPERLRTMAAAPADQKQIAGFTPIMGGLTSSQSFLQDIAIYTGTPDTGTPLKGQPDGKKKIVWAFDGSVEVVASCLYEGGISLTRSLGRPKSCTATIQRSKDPGSSDSRGWGMDRASFRCN